MGHNGGKLTKILLVEDDPDLLDLTAYVLRRERFFVIEAKDDLSALRGWKTERPDLVILALGLPGIDRFAVVRRIRAESQTPILMIAGRVDYRELISRVRAILTAQGAQEDEPEPSMEIDGLVLDPIAYEVRRRSESVPLTPTEFRILYLLVTNAGHAVPAGRLYSYVWGGPGAGANALRSHMSHLRRKLEVLGVSSGTISSVPAVGYVFRRAAQPEVATTPFAVTTTPRIVARGAGSAA